MSKTIVHVQTIVTTVFGELDELGNVVGKAPVTVEIARLHADDYNEAFQKLIDAREQMKGVKAE